MIVVTDLDGTLLDHTSYSFTAARPAMDELARRNIPLILNTSKTRAELGELMAELDLQTPFIVENGSAIYGVDGALILSVGAHRATLLRVLNDARAAGFSFTSYSDMSVDDVMAHTGLGRAQAAQSATREHTEPLIWDDTEEALTAFVAFVEAQNLQCVRGGRFLHVMGQCNKGLAMQLLIERCYPGTRGPVVALGDSENDRPMLEQADFAVVVRSAKHAPLDIAGHSKVYTTEAVGPQGWSDTLLKILAQ